MTAHASEWLKHHHATFQEPFERCGQLAESTGDFLKSLGFKNTNPRQVLLAGLFVRLVQLFEGAMWLAQWGMEPAARAVMRAELEAAFALVALTKDETVLKRLIARDERQRLKLINALQSSASERFRSIDKQGLKRLGAEVASGIEDLDADEISIAECARIAGMQDWYDTVYRLYSEDVHTSIREIERAHLRIEGGAVEAVRGVPTSEDTLTLIGTGSQLILMAAEALISVAGRGSTSILSNKAYFQAISRRKP